MARSLAAVLCPRLPPREGTTARHVAISAVFTGDTVLGHAQATDILATFVDDESSDGARSHDRLGQRASSSK